MGKRSATARGPSLVDRLRPYVPDHVFRHLAASRDEIPGERRWVTVVFADLSGFTTFSEKMDPEDVARIVNDALDQLARPVIARDGTIDKYLGDALMAVFGAPVSHPDDARRALDAAWEMRRRIQRMKGLNLSIGVHTGLVISGNVGSAGRREYTVIGDAVNVAARLEAAAARGEILVSDVTVRSAGPSFRFGPRRDARVKGRQQAVAVRALLGVRRLPPAETWRLRPAFIGRDRDLRALDEIAERGGRVVVAGPAGIGKTMLMNHLCPLLARSRRVLTVGMRFNAAARPYQVIRDIVARLNDPSSAPAARLLSSSGATPKQIAAALRPALAARPTALILEDLHRADEPSRLVLRNLGEIPRLSIVATARPVNGLRELLAHAEIRELEELNEADICELIRRLLGSRAAPRGSADLARKIGGLPLAIEETVRHLVAQGHFYLGRRGEWQYWRTGTSSLSLTTIVRSRLDSLPVPARALVNQVAIFGSAPFDYLIRPGSPERRARAALRAAESAGILAREARTVSFKHDYYRAVAYETLLRRTRRDLHLRAARLLEKAHASPAELATHYLNTTQDRRAFDNLSRAAARATSFHAFITAQDYLEHAVRLARRMRDARAEVRTLLQLAHVHLRISNNRAAARDLARARRLLGRSGLEDLRLTLWMREATWAKNMGRVAEMRRHCGRILRHTRAHGDAKASALETLGAQFWREGKNPRAIRLYERVLKMSGTAHRTRMVALNALGDLYRITGRWELAEDRIRMILRHDRDAGWPLLHRGRLRMDQERMDEALRDFRETLSRARQNDDRRLEALVLRDLARAEIEAGRIDAGLEYLDRGLAVVRPIFSYLPRAFAEAALIFARLGRPARAAAYLRRAEIHHRRIRLMETDAVLLETRMALAQNRGDLISARRFFKKLAALRRRMGMMPPRLNPSAEAVKLVE